MSDRLPDPPPVAGPMRASSEPRPPARRVDSRDLMGGARELVIVHAGREYRLRVTAHGKLILTA